MFPKNPPSGASAAALCALAVLLALPVAAGATERFYAVPEIRISEMYDTNAFNREDADPDYFTRVQPSLRLRDQNDLGMTELKLGLGAHFQKNFPEENGVDRRLAFRMNRKLTKRFSWNSEGSYAFVDGGELPADSDPTLQGGRPDQEISDLSAGWSYLLTARNSLNFNVGWLEQTWSGGDTTTDSSRRDRESLRGTLSLVRQWSDFDRTSLSLVGVGNTFSATAKDPETSSFNLSLNGAWIRAWNARWSTVLTLGIRRLNSETAEELVPREDPSFPFKDPSAFQDTTRDEVSFAFVGGFNLTRNAERAKTELSFARSTQPRSGFGTDQNVDQIRLTHRVNVTKRAGVSFAMSWLHQESVGDSVIRLSPGFARFFDFNTGGTFEDFTCIGTSGQLAVQGDRTVCAFITEQALDAQILNLRLELDYDLNQRLQGFVKWEYQDQTSKGTQPLPQFNENRFLFGVRYSFDVDIL